MAVTFAAMAVIAAGCHVHGEARPTTGRAVAQGTSAVPLIFPAMSGLEAKQLQDLLHGDFSADAVEVDTGHTIVRERDH